jgi:WD40 repeat protein
MESHVDSSKQYDFHLPPLIDLQEARRRILARTAETPTEAVILEPDATWQATSCEGLAVFANGTRAASWRREDSLRRWDIQRGQELPHFADKTEWSGRSTVFGSSADGRIVLAASDLPGGIDHEIRFGIFRLRDADQPAWVSFKETRGPSGFAVNHLLAVSISADGSSAVGIDDRRKWHIFDLTATQLVRSFDLTEGNQHCLALSPDGSLLLLGNEQGTVRLLRTSDGTDLKEIRIEGRTRKLCFSPDGRWLAAGNNDGQRCTVNVWSLANIERIQWKYSFVDYSHEPILAFSPARNFLATSGIDGDLIHVWDLSNGKEVIRMTGIPGTCALAFSEDGTRFVAGGSFNMLSWKMPNSPP